MIDSYAQLAWNTLRLRRDQLLERHIARFPVRRRWISVEEAVIQKSQHLAGSIHYVGEAPIVAIYRLEATPAILYLQAVWGSRDCDARELEFGGEGHRAIRDLVQSGAQESAPE